MCVGHKWDTTYFGGEGSDQTMEFLGGGIYSLGFL